MKVFAISDLHLSSCQPKPMDVFGYEWVDYFDKIKNHWLSVVTEDDIVLICGDLSWALRLDSALPDIKLIADLPGKKIIIKGNHDYWWNTIGQLRNSLPDSVYAIQNDCVRYDNLLICGTRGWVCPDPKLSQEDDKIYKREQLRLKLSLDNMNKHRKANDTVILMMHYPPFNSKYEESEFIKLIVSYDIKTVVYGHLHGKDCRSDLFLNRFGVNFYLTSTDLVKHQLVRII